MKIYKIHFTEIMQDELIHKFFVPAKSKREAIQHVRDRIFWDLEPYTEVSGKATESHFKVKKIQILKELPEYAQHDPYWWNRVQESRKNWLEITK